MYSYSWNKFYYFLKHRSSIFKCFKNQKYWCLGAPNLVFPRKYLADVKLCIQTYCNIFFYFRHLCVVIYFFYFTVWTNFRNGYWNVNLSCLYYMFCCVQTWFLLFCALIFWKLLICNVNSCTLSQIISYIKCTS
jgi:hypothetical protein